MLRNANDRLQQKKIKSLRERAVNGNPEQNVVKSLFRDDGVGQYQD